MITINLNIIRKHKPCQSGWEKLLKSLNKTQADNEPLTFSRIAESNGISDALWCLRALGKKHKKERLYLVADIADSVSYIFEKKYPGDKRIAECIQAIRDYADGRIRKSTLLKKRDAAVYAVYAAADAAADAAVYAVYAAAYAAAYAVYAADAADAAYAGAGAAERKKQLELIKKHLG